MIKTTKAKLMSISVRVLISCFMFCSLSAQNKPDSLRVEKLYAQAETLADQQQFTNASVMALEAAKLFEDLKDWDKWSVAYYLISQNARYSEDYTFANKALQEAINKVPDSRPGIRAEIQFHLAYTLESTGYLYAAKEYYLDCVPAFKNNKDTAWLIPAYGNLGIIYTKKGQYHKAIDYLKESINLARKYEGNPNIWFNLYNLGKAYYHEKDLVNAQKIYQEAQSLYDPEDGTFEYANAEILLKEKEYDKAIQSLQKAIRLSNKKYGPNREYTAEMEFLSGKIYHATQAPQKALSIYLSLLPYYKTIADKRELAKLYIRIADTQNTLQNNDQALKNYQNALRILIPDFESDDPTTNPGKKELSNEIWLMEIFKGKGVCFLAKYQQDKNKRWLEIAEKNYQAAIDFIQQIKLSFEESLTKLSLGSYTHPFYEDLIKIKLTRFELSQDKQYLEDAFQLAQTANAFVLRELLNEQEALSIAGVTPDTIQLLKDIRKQTILIKRQIEKRSKPEADSLQTILSSLETKQQTIKQSLEQNYPKYAQLRNDLKVAASTHLQEKLDDSSLFIKYFLGADTLYIFSVSKSGLQVHISPLPDNFDQLIFQYRRAISDLDFITKSPQIAEQEYLQSAHQLYTILLEQTLNEHSLSANIPRLIIAADGILNTIPFQTLLLKKSKSWIDSQHYLISKYAISYIYFSKMLLDKPKPSNAEGGFIAFGLEFDDYTLEHLSKISKDSIKNEAILENIRSNKFSRLPFSVEEAKELAILMNGKPWLNDKATKSNFLKHSKQANIIHVATHSVLDQKNPNYSSLVFIKKKDSLDNLLRLYEIYNQGLKADLIVLSACNTGFGSRQRGEGINSLARAFNFAGIPSITATFWSISDESSKKIMKLYYQFLKAGHPKDIALQKAQLEYLNNDEISSPAFRLPVYWAAWMQVGSNDELPTGKRSFLSSGVLLFAGALFLLGLYLGRRKFTKPSL